MIESIIGFLAFFFLSIVFRLPIGYLLGGIGFLGLGIVRGWDAAIYSTSNEVLEATGYSLSIIPLFVLMGNFVSRGGLSRDLYRCAYAFTGHRRGGLATSTILACAGFGAVCGSSTATVATMAKVAVPEMKRLGYSSAFAAATVGAGGTLGILIPPSALMVVYGIMTETSIGALFAAGLMPGVLAAALYIAAATWTVWRNPASGPAGERTSWINRLKAVQGVWAVLLLFLIVIGGLYSGYFTSTEAAGIGATGGFMIAWIRKTLTWSALADILVDSAATTGMLFVIMIGAMIFSNFINMTGMPSVLQETVSQLTISPIFVIVLICLIYIGLGCVMESMSIILLTVPIFFPLVTGLGFDPVWFGILIVCVVEVGLITPPVGMNVFVLKAIMPEVSINSIWKSMVPYIIADSIRLLIIIAVPALSLFLPKYLHLI